jgi:2-polyprenyl-6-methoxyphenol hydroxylase-like FAD-dependent oxidoreductase
MGTTSAFVGAYILAGEIAKHCGGDAQNLPRALSGYEQRFRPFMAQVQEGVSEGLPIPTSAFGIGILNLLLSVASWMNWNIFGSMVLRENVKNWELPEYKELTQALAGGK